MDIKTAKKIIETIETTEWNHDPLDFDRAIYLDVECVWYRPKTTEEIEALNSYYGFNDIWQRLDDDDIGKWCVISHQFDTEDYEIDHDALEQSIKFISRMLESFGIDHKIG